MSAGAQRCFSFVILTLALASATACSGAKSGDASSADASPAAGSGDSTAVIDPCKKLALADVQAFFSAPLSAKHDDDLFGTAAGCIYHTPDDHTNVQVVVVTGLHAEAFYDENSKHDGRATVALAGIGDKAVRPAGDVWIYGMKNGIFCMIDSDIHGRASLKGAEKYADAPIPDAIAGPIAQRLAGLCTTLWQ